MLILLSTIKKLLKYNVIKLQVNLWEQSKQHLINYQQKICRLPKLQLPIKHAKVSFLLSLLEVSYLITELELLEAALLQAHPYCVWHEVQS